MTKYTNHCIALLFLLNLNTLTAQESSKAKDSTKKATKELPLEPTRKVNFTTDKGTWISVDVSPDGSTIMFDMMGDLYTFRLLAEKQLELLKVCLTMYIHVIVLMEKAFSLFLIKVDRIIFGQWI